MCFVIQVFRLPDQDSTLKIVSLVLINYAFIIVRVNLDHDKHAENAKIDFKSTFSTRLIKPSLFGQQRQKVVFDIGYPKKEVKVVELDYQFEVENWVNFFCCILHLRPTRIGQFIGRR